MFCARDAPAKSAQVKSLKATILTLTGVNRNAIVTNDFGMCYLRGMNIVIYSFIVSAFLLEIDLQARTT